jgi:small subunit ribosomal protein S20
MANIASAQKRVRQTARRRTRNQATRTRLRSSVKAYRAADKAGKSKAIPATYAEIDRALARGVIHKNAAARYKSRLARAAASK